ncbi:hypothetical protein [Pontibacter mangrovi]|uniref:Uncharacterized protein n=1 Tax=Pontibacter mangrovi TaxID=2589816 RepID=A0A501W1Y4_9BACT|nr:hypothetical protein [Pontibacter mangrovi]TPE43268.1 hypothetical protein FJM65_14245 [Pontibacter mangrovi]
MQLFRNSYFKLDYDPTTDVLFVDLPDMRTAGLSEAKLCFSIMLDYVMNYHIRNILLDSSKAVVEVEDTLYHALIYEVSMQLKSTSLQRVARVVSNLPELEVNAVLVQGEVLESQGPVYKIQNFSTKEQAFAWLSVKTTQGDQTQNSSIPC